MRSRSKGATRLYSFPSRRGARTHAAPLGKSLTRPTQRGGYGNYSQIAHIVERTQRAVLYWKLVRPLSRQLIAARRALSDPFLARSENRSDCCNTLLAR